VSKSNGPKQVYIIRHGEKLGDATNDRDGGPDLSIRGSARAAAIPSLFVPSPATLSCCPLAAGVSGFQGSYVTVNIQTNTPRFQTPDFLFATQASSHSNRPVETVTPLSAALNLSLDSKHADAEYGKVATDILTNSKYADKTVLVCWHHGNIPNLAGALGVPNPPKWPGTAFDRVWQVTFPGGAAMLDDLAQMLLYGDADK
jgi:broad specificity phosphatase PhoE